MSRMPNHLADYIPVAARLHTFRGDHPEWSLKTKVTATAKGLLAVATVRDGEGRHIANGHAYEEYTSRGFDVERAETSAVGRALAHVGYTPSLELSQEELERAARVRPPSPDASKPAAAPATPAAPPADYTPSPPPATPPARNAADRAETADVARHGESSPPPPTDTSAPPSEASFQGLLGGDDDERNAATLPPGDDVGYLIANPPAASASKAKWSTHLAAFVAAHAAAGAAEAPIDWKLHSKGKSFRELTKDEMQRVYAEAVYELRRDEA